MKLSDIEDYEFLVPYSSHIGEGVVQTKNYDLVTTWQLDGEPSECKSALDLDISSMMIHNYLKSFAAENVTFYVHVVRSRMQDSFEVTSGNYFADRVSKLYYENIREQTFRKNSIYFTMVFSPYTAMERGSYKNLSLESKKQELRQKLKIMEEYSGSISSFLQRFGGRKLTAYSNDQGVTFSKQLEFYNFLLTNIWQKIPVTSTPIYNIIGTGDVFFANQSGQINVLGEQKYFRIVEILEFPKCSTSLSIASVLISDCDFVITQSFSCLPKRKALSSIKLIERKLRASASDAYSEKDDLIEAKDELAGGESFLGDYHFSMAVYGESLDEVTKKTNKQFSILSDVGFVPKLAEYSLGPNFFAQLPGVFDLRPRLSPINSKNFVNFASFCNFESGKRDRNCWGQALAILKTSNKQPYYLNLHESNIRKDEFGEKRLANTSVIGTAGAGKTMLLSFMQIMMQKYNLEESFNESSNNKTLTTIFLDKDRGAEINIRALGGKYYAFKDGEPTGWNPFCLPATNNNISFLKELIRLLCRSNGEILTARQQEEISASVDAVMSRKEQDRSYGITRCIESLNQSTSKEDKANDLVMRLRRWSKEGEHGWIFDNEEDSFKIDDCTNFGFDGTEFLEKENIRSPISFYILHRVEEILDGRRVVIFMDEFWKWIADDVFADFAYNKLKTIRKLNGFLIAATQSPDEILKHQISRAVIEVCSTQIFLANPKATKKDYIDGFKVTEEEYKIIKNLDPDSRCFLIKKSSLHGNSRPFSAVVSFDLKALGVNTKILSGSEDNVKIFHKIYKEDLSPEQWIDEFLEVAV